MESYIAFLDILGFENIVNNTPLDNLFKKMGSAVAMSKLSETLGTWQKKDDTIYPNLANKHCHCFSFSDTFVIITPDRSLNSLNDIISATFLLSRALFGMGMPVRGSITAGEVDFVPDTQHLIGKGIIQARNLEKKQEWFGIAIDPKIANESTIPSLEETVQEVVILYKVPLKNDEECECVVINWRMNLYAENGTASLFPEPSEGIHVVKRDNTLKFAKHIRQLGRSCKATNEPLLQNFISGAGVQSGSPSDIKLKHGDEY